MKLTEDIILMGHSFGGITALGASSLCPKAKATIGLDPWFFPHKEDNIKCGDH